MTTARVAPFEGRVVLDANAPIADESGDVLIRKVGGLHAAKTDRILESLAELAKALISASPADVPKRVIDAVFEHIPAERGFLMLRDASGGLRPHVVKYRNPAAEPKITISKTMADRVVTERVAILTSDAQSDPRFARRASVQSHSIRSAMCVPLWHGDEVVGIIHVDTPAQTNSFDEFDLQLLSALANYAAVALEQARLNQQVRDEQRARERLEKYFSPSTVTRILSEGEKDVEEIEATILFADLVGFTRLAERLNAAAVAELLNRYFSCMADVVLEHDGTVDKFIGDCIMAVFGAPYPQHEHAPCAVRAALAMRARLAELNAASRDAPLAMRVGINTGRVVAGPIGSLKRKEITVLGDAVNVAARLEATVARPGTIVVGERTYALIKHAYAATPLGSFALRGKENAITAYELSHPPSRSG